MTMHVEGMPHPRGQAVTRMDRRASQTHLRKTLNRTLPMCLRNSEGAPQAPSANAPFPLDIRCHYAPDVNDAPFPVDARSTARAFPVAMHMRSGIAHVHSRRFTRAFPCVRMRSPCEFFRALHTRTPPPVSTSPSAASPQILRLSAPPREPLPRPSFTRRSYPRTPNAPSAVHTHTHLRSPANKVRSRAFACVRRANFFAHFTREHAARLDLSLRQNSQILRLSAPPREPLPRPLFTRRPYSDIVRSHK